MEERDLLDNLPILRLLPGDARALVVGSFEPVSFSFGDTIVREGMQEWCRRFERFLRHHPDMWLFWLDRRWGRWIEQGSARPNNSAWLYVE